MGRDREREGEKHRCARETLTPTRDLACNPGTCPDWESNQRPSGLQASTQSTEPHQPGLSHHFCRCFLILLSCNMTLKLFFLCSDWVIGIDLYSTISFLLLALSSEVFLIIVFSVVIFSFDSIVLLTAILLLGLRVFVIAALNSIIASSKSIMTPTVFLLERLSWFFLC